MIEFLKKRTVLVLGAGASHSYGFPLGSGLKQAMLGTFNRQTRKRMKTLGFDDALVQEFQDALRFGIHPTIDIFLERKTRFRELGSYLIATTLMPLEQPGPLFPQKDWYGDLFRALSLDGDGPDTTNLDVVTLNYDRSLEHFLCKNIDYNCADARTEAAHAKREKILVVHAHGSLGKYPDVPYGTKPDDEAALRAAADSIKIVSDKLEDSADFRLAQDTLSKAERIIFLGFGYNERTLSALLQDVDLGQTEFHGTAVKLGEERKRTLAEAFQNRINLGDDNQDCAAFLRHIKMIPDK